MEKSEETYDRWILTNKGASVKDAFMAGWREAIDYSVPYLDDARQAIRDAADHLENVSY